MNNTQLMSLGLFVFEMKTALFQEAVTDLSATWAKKQSIGAGPVHEYIGRGAITKKLSGQIVPGITGRASTIDKLREMALSGKSWLLTSGSGQNFGYWIIEQVSETHKHLQQNGTPRFIEFSLSLSYAPDLQNRGSLGDSKP